MIPLSDDSPSRTFPFATLAIIALNAWVYFGWQTHIGLETSVEMGAFVPRELTLHIPGAATRIFIAMFMHGGLMHLLGNMWFLWVFGERVENATGVGRFIVFYLLCGVLATLAHVSAEPLSRVPLVGASGAISGVLGGYLARHPTAKVRTLIPLWIFARIVEIPAFLFFFIWIAMQVLSEAAARGHRGQAGVAYLAHIGGFAAGLVLIFLFQQGKPPRRVRVRRLLDEE